MKEEETYIRNMVLPFFYCHKTDQIFSKDGLCVKSFEWESIDRDIIRERFCIHIAHKQTEYGFSGRKRNFEGFSASSEQSQELSDFYQKVSNFVRSLQMFSLQH